MRHKHKRSPITLKKIHLPSKGKIGHRIIGKIIHEEHEYTLHATKGYRSTRAR